MTVAATAVQRWPVHSTGAFSEDLSADTFGRRDNPARQPARLPRCLEALGYWVTIAEKAATPRARSMAFHPNPLT